MSSVDLTTIERDVLEALCAARVTRSSVMLAEELWSRPRSSLVDADPFGLLVVTLESLNERGLVTYVLRGVHGTVPLDVRVTPEGYQACGYSTTSHEVGRGGHLHHAVDDGARHPGDGTDFRNYQSHTVGGAIERMPLAEHVVRYPEHAYRHREQTGETR